MVDGEDYVELSEAFHRLETGNYILYNIHNPLLLIHSEQIYIVYGKRSKFT